MKIYIFIGTYPKKRARSSHRFYRHMADFYTIEEGVWISVSSLRQLKVYLFLISMISRVHIGM